MGKRGRLFSAALSIVAHAGLVIALMSVRAERPYEPPFQEAVMVSMVGMPLAPPAPPAPQPTAPSPPEPEPRRNSVRPTPTPRVVPTLAAAETPSEEPGVELSDAQLASATTASGGGRGRACDMVEWLERELRKDPRVHDALARAHRQSGLSSRAIMVWDGDWIRTRGEQGKGVAGVREAIMTEVAFAPEACRNDPIRGLVVLTLNDAPGAPKLALGSGAWRWSDLLFPRRA